MLTYQNLIDDIAKGCKPKNQWRIGLEHERFAYNIETGAALPYNGTPSIRELLESFASKFGWEVIQEKERPIALSKAGIQLTLEPGGQVEYSGSPLESLDKARDEMGKLYSDLDAAAKLLGIGFLPIGLHPTWTRQDIHKMPKQRYDIMSQYMETKGNHGLDMMLRTCGTQINLDYSDEIDMIKKFRVALALQPITIALMANSHILEGLNTEYLSYRSYIWTDTDNDRCGILPFVFNNNMSFAKYVDYALDVPMYFIRRQGEYINVAGQSFHKFLIGDLVGYEGELPTINDWHDHLTTLFPEVRLKQYLELRGADSNTPEMAIAMAAFWSGLFYDEAILNTALKLIQGWPIEEHKRIREAVPKLGLSTPTPDGRDLNLLAQDFIDMLPGQYLEPFKAKLIGSEPLECQAC